MPIENKMFNVTTDGTPFENLAEAQAHENEYQKEKVILQFLDEGPGESYSKRGKASARRIIGDFYDMLSNNGVQLNGGLEGPVLTKDAE